MAIRNPTRTSVIDLGAGVLHRVGSPFPGSPTSVYGRPGRASVGLITPLVSTVVSPPSGWGDGVAFGARPVQSTTIVLNGVNGVTIENLYFNNGALNPDSPFIFNTGRAANSHVCIRVLNSINVTIRNVDFREVSQPIEVSNSDNVYVEYTRTRGIVGPATRFNQQTGNFLQTHNGCNNVYIRYAKIIATTQFSSNPYHWPTYGANLDNNAYNPTVMMCEDIISLYGASNCGIEDSQIDGTGYFRNSGTGIILGDQLGTDNYARRNTMLNGGQVGINVVGGHDHFVQNNRVWADSYTNRDYPVNRSDGSPYTYGHNQCMVHYQYQSNPLSGVTFSGNRTYSAQGRHYWALPAPAVSYDNVYGDGTLNRNDFVVTL